MRIFDGHCILLKNQHTENSLEPVVFQNKRPAKHALQGLFLKESLMGT